MSTAIRRSSTIRASVLQVKGSAQRRTRDWLATEEPLEIRLIPHGAPLPGTAISVTMRTPGNDFELAAGFLYSEGILPGREAVARISYCVSDQDGSQQYNIVNVWLRPGVPFLPEQLQRNFYMTSSCGVCGKASLDAVRVAVPGLPGDDVTVTPEVLTSLPVKLREAQAVFTQTGGLHAAGLFDTVGNLLVAREDVGRHNAVDKVVGHSLLQGIDLKGSILMVSGRTSFEIMQKAAVAGIPVVVAVSAPSSLAVQVAQEFGLTLVGFMRHDRFNVYTGAERLAPAAECSH